MIHKGQHLSPSTEFKKGLVPWNKNKKGIHLSPQSEFKKGMVSYNKGKKGICLNTGRTHIRKGQHLSVRTEFKKNHHFSLEALRALSKRPTKPERILIDIIQKNGYPFRYVGNGNFSVGNKCPDFIATNGKKKVIEVFGRRFHDPKCAFVQVPYHQTEGGTLEHYINNGFDCLIIWDDEISDTAIIRRLEDFSKCGNA